MPRRVTLADPGQILGFSVDSQGIHTINRVNSNQLKYCIYSLSTGKAEYESNIPTDAASFLGTNPGRNIGLYNTGDGDSLTLLRDGNGTIYPLSRDCLESIRDPHWLDLPPMRCLGMGSHSLQGVGPGQKSQALVLVLVTENHQLMPRLLACDIEGVRHALAALETSPVNVQSVINERCDGGRNIIHACVSMCTPTSNKDADVQEERNVLSSVASAIVPDPLDSLPPVGLSSSSRAVSLREMMRRAAVARPSDSGSGADGGLGAGGGSVPVEGISIPTLNWPPEPLALESSSHGDEEQAAASSSSSSSGSGNAGVGSSKTASAAVSDPVERRANALAALKAITESPTLHPHLPALLSARDAQGHTPFMQAVAVRAYPAALALLDVATRLARLQSGGDPENQKKVVQSYIFPLGKAGCSPDDSPLHVLCSNDTCSFTWTGAEHINQDIFECRTCGLTGSLCCCTECARVCHKGHDCKLKRTSPTAYCDCWEKCKCKALIAGKIT